MTPKQKAMQALKERQANKPEQIDNSRLHAGSPMYYYCRLCGHTADVLSESHTSPPKKLCGNCQHMKDMGWLDN